MSLFPTALLHDLTTFILAVICAGAIVVAAAAVLLPEGLQ